MVFPPSIGDLPMDLPRLRWRFGHDVRGPLSRWWETLGQRWWETHGFIWCFYDYNVIWNCIWYMVILFFFWFWLRGAFGVICHLVCRCTGCLSLFLGPISTLSIFRDSSPHFMKCESNNQKSMLVSSWFYCPGLSFSLLPLCFFPVL